MNHLEESVKVLLGLRYKKVESQVRSELVGLYGQKLRFDFVCDEEIIYEVKYQENRGTADQKLAYAIAEIKECYRLPTYLLLAGVGWSRGAISWAKKQPKSDVFLGCLSMDEFLGVIKNVKA